MATVMLLRIVPAAARNGPFRRQRREEVHGAWDICCALQVPLSLSGGNLYGMHSYNSWSITILSVSDTHNSCAPADSDVIPAPE